MNGHEKGFWIIKRVGSPTEGDAGIEYLDRYDNLQDAYRALDKYGLGKSYFIGYVPYNGANSNKRIN